MYLVFVLMTDNQCRGTMYLSKCIHVGLPGRQKQIYFLVCMKMLVLCIYNVPFQNVDDFTIRFVLLNLVKNIGVFQTPRIFHLIAKAIQPKNYFQVRL